MKIKWFALGTIQAMAYIGGCTVLNIHTLSGRFGAGLLMVSGALLPPLWKACKQFLDSRENKEPSMFTVDEWQ